MRHYSAIFIGVLIAFAPVEAAMTQNNLRQSDFVNPPVPLGNPGEWIKTDDYPIPALRMEQEGLVGFRLLVNADGRVDECTVIESSNNYMLDGATCFLIARRAQFTPATDAEGVAVSGYYANRVQWRMPTDAEYIQLDEASDTSAPPAGDLPPYAPVDPLAPDAKPWEDVSIAFDLILTSDEKGDMISCETSGSSTVNGQKTPLTQEKFDALQICAPPFPREQLLFDEAGVLIPTQAFIHMEYGRTRVQPANKEE